MHTLFFGIKRAHLRVVALTRPFLEDACLTPARFDMLRIVSLRPHGILQRNVQYVLGVSGATVSRMIRSLELLGLVVRKRYERDRRCLLVTITEVGIDIMRRAMDGAIDSGAAEQLAARGTTGDRCVDSANDHVHREVIAFEDMLVRARAAYDDPSPVRHPWSGDPLGLAFTLPDDVLSCTAIACSA